MKLRFVAGISAMFFLMLSAIAQDSSIQLSSKGPGTAASSDSSVAAAVTADQPQGQLGPQDTLRAYEQQMQIVFQKTCEELDAVTQAVYNGNITPEQAEYLSAERFELGMMRFQLLRTRYLSTAYDVEKVTQSKSTELYVLGNTVVVPPPF